MTSIRLTSLLLWLLLAFILFKYSIAHHHQVAAPVGAISVNQELSKDVVVASLRESWIKGRKMLVERKEEMMKEKGVNGGSSEISGKAKNASGKLFGKSKDGSRNVQVSKISKPKTSDSINMETNGSNSQSPEEHHPRTPQTPKVSKAPLVDSNLEPSSSEVAASQEPHEVFHEVESQRLVEHAIEAMGMLNMDYNSPHRKPPISNGHPTKEEKNRRH